MPRRPKRAVGGLYGNWDDMRFWANQTRRRATITKIKKRVRLLGNAIISRMHKHIDHQDLGWPPLAKVTQRQKGHAKAYLETGQFKRNIRRRTTEKGSYTLVLEIYPHGYHKQANMPMTELAFILEFGRLKKANYPAIPARPLWAPTMLEIPKIPEYKIFAQSVVSIMLPLGSRV